MDTMNLLKVKNQISNASAPENDDTGRGKVSRNSIVGNLDSQESSPKSPVPSSSSTSKSKSKRRRSVGQLKKSAREDRHDDGSTRRTKSKSKNKSGDPSPPNVKKKKKKKDRTLSLTRSGDDTDGSGNKTLKSRKEKIKNDKKTSSRNRGDDSRENSLKGSGSDPEHFETSVPEPRSLPEGTSRHVAVRPTGDLVDPFSVASPASSEVGLVKKSASQLESSRLVRKVKSSKSGNELERIKHAAAATTKRRTSLESPSTKPSKALSTGSPIANALDRSSTSGFQERASILNNTGGGTPILPGEHLDDLTTPSTAPKRPSSAEGKSVTSCIRRMPKESFKRSSSAHDDSKASNTPSESTKPQQRRSASVGKYVSKTTQRSLKSAHDDSKASNTPSESTKPQQRRSASVGKYVSKTTQRSFKSKATACKNSDDADDFSSDSNKVQDAMNLFGGKVKRTLSPKQKSLDVAPKQKSLDVGKLRQAYLKQDANKAVKESPTSLAAPSFAKGGGKKALISRTTSGGNNMRKAYLQHLTSGGDDAVSSSTTSKASLVGEVRMSSLSNLSTSNEKKDTSQNASRNLAKSLGLFSTAGTNKTKASPVTNEKIPGTTTTGSGGVQSAYLNTTRTRSKSPLQTKRTQPRVPASSVSASGPSKLNKNPFLSEDNNKSKGQEKNDSMELKGPPKRNGGDTGATETNNSVKNFIASKNSGKTQEVRRGGPKEPSSIALRRSSSAGKIDKLRTNPAMQFLGAKFGKPKEGGVSSIASRADAFSAIYGSDNKEKSTLEDISTPKGVRRRLNLSALNLATPGGKSQRKTAPKRKDMKKLLSQESGNASFANTVVSLLRDRSKKSQVRELCDRMQKADGIPKTRRLSMRDNDLIVSMIGAIQNDPDVKSIIVDGDVAFNTVSTTLLFQFLEALGMNMHLRRLTFKNVQLGNDVLYALATAMEKNFILEVIDMSWNLFTSEGLSNFCQALANTNQTCKRVILNNQTTPVSVASEVDVLEAFSGNKRIMYAKVDFNSDDGMEKLTKILHHNKRSQPGPFDRDKRIIDLLSFEAERAEAIMEQRKAENQPLEVPEDDWEYLYELAVLFDRYKLKDIVESENNDSKKSKPKNADSLSKDEKSNFLFGQFKDILDDSIGCFNSDGSFLTVEFISKYLKKTQDTDELVFDFHGQWKLFKRFPVTDPAREIIVAKFVDAIVSHPKMKEFMGINMANTGCGDDFLEKLAERCLTDPSLLPNLHVINFETNFINERGCVALSKLISNPKCLRYLQLIRLENQKGLLTSKAEFAIYRAMFVNRSVVVVSLQFRGLMERQQIHSYVSRNVDFLRQARQRHYKKTGTGRKRNEMEVYFDKIASNHQFVKGEVNLPGDRKILSLSAEERIKAAKSFAENKNITSINLNGCELDDAFAEALGQSLLTNTAIEKVSLENNSISATGIRYLFEGIAKNPKLKELRLHKQSKNIPAAEEDALVDILESNQTLTKLGIDLRSQNAQVKVDRQLKMNDRLTRSLDSSDNLNYLFT